MLALVAVIPLLPSATRVTFGSVIICHYARNFCANNDARGLLKLACNPNTCNLLAPTIIGNFVAVHSISSTDPLVPPPHVSLHGPTSPTPIRNFALHAAGASVIPSLTSTTHGLIKHDAIHRMFTSLSGFDFWQPNIALPYVSLEDNIGVGECWEFTGAHGYLAVHLPEPIVISQFSLDHVAPDIISEMSAQRAPRDVILWGLLDEAHTLALHNVTGFRSPFYFSNTGLLPTAFNPTDKFVEISSMKYNLGALDFRQYETTFLNVSVQTIVLEILSNFGAPTTCLYFLGIYS